MKVLLGDAAEHGGLIRGLQPKSLVVESILPRQMERFPWAGHLGLKLLPQILKKKETLPCFCFGTRTSLLPAFGSFTGNQVIRPTPDDRIYVVAGDEVFEMQK